MADKKRSQSLQEQLDRLLAQAPKPYTAAEEAEIKRGRKGQADIDAGRATIEKRNEEARKAQDQIDKLNEQIGRAISEERTAAKEDTEGGIKAKERAEKETLLGRGVQVASGLPAMKGGIFLGRAMGAAANERADKGQEFKNTVLRKIADDRVAGLTTREGAISGAQRAGVLPSKNPILRAIPRGSSQFGLGAAAAGLGAYDLATTNPNDPWLTVAARTALGGAGVGAGVGLAEQGWERMMNPKVSPDGAALARIESNQLRRGGLNQAIDKGQLQPTPTQPGQAALPPPDESSRGPTPGSKEHLREQAKALGAKVTTRMSKEELAKAISDKATEAGSRRVRGPRIPKGGGAAAVAGGLAYAMTPVDAEASTGAPTGGGQARALGNAALAGGTAYGVSRGLNAMGPIAQGVMAGAGEAMLPSTIDAMTDWHGQPEGLQKLDQFATRYLPNWMTGGSQQRLGMAQVPERNPARPVAGMFGDLPEDQELQAAMEAFLAEAAQDDQEEAQPGLY